MIPRGLKLFSLQLYKGGLGFTQAVDLTLPTFLGSMYATEQLVLSLLHETEPTEDILITEAMALWNKKLIVNFLQSIEELVSWCGMGFQRIKFIKTYWIQALTHALLVIL